MTNCSTAVGDYRYRAWDGSDFGSAVVFPLYLFRVVVFWFGAPRRRADNAYLVNMPAADQKFWFAANAQVCQQRFLVNITGSSKF